MKKVVFKYKTGTVREMEMRYADILQKLGRGSYATRELRPADPVEPDLLSELRAEYQKVVGKRPYHGWDEDELRKRIAEFESN